LAWRLTSVFARRVRLPRQPGLAFSFDLGARLMSWVGRCVARCVTGGRIVTQLELFDGAKRTGPPAVAVRTSIAAAQAIADMAPTLRGKVYGYIAQASAGATRQEIADGLQLKLQTVCGRVGELKGMGLVWEGSESRDGRRVIRVSRG
jgi:hypothetical protein